MLSTTFKFRLPGDEARWKLRVKELIKTEEQRFILTRDGEPCLDLTVSSGPEALSKPRILSVPDHDLTLDFGAVSLLAYGLIVRREDEILWRSHKKPFREASAFDDKLQALNAKIDSWDTKEPTEEQKAFQARQKALRPSIYVDIAFGVLFFFVAREFGLVTAALSGAAATLVLVAINPFVKWDLLGGFAVFGVVMALISAGIAWAFQDDLIIKLRGTIMALIGASFALFDAFVLQGGYLGKRMAMYMEGIGRLNPKKASLALATATLIIMAIDTPLAFLLTTDQWIWYNAFLDSLIAIPIVLVCMYLARERS